MKVAQVDVVYGAGSTGKIVKAIHDHLLDVGHDSKVFYGRGPDEGEPNVSKISHDLEVFVDAGLSRLTGYTGVFSPMATNKLLASLDAFQPDVVHLHEIHGYFVNYFRLIEYLKKRNIPVVWTLHCEMAYTGRCGYAFGCDQWKTACQKCPQLNDYPRSLLFDRSAVQFERKKNLLSDMDRITFAPVSNWLHDRLTQSFLKNKQATVVHNGINTAEIFYPRDTADLVRRHQLEGRYIALSVAPDLMSERKGGSWVLEIAKRSLGKPITFVMIGVVEKLTDLPPNVIVLPPTRDQNELARYYSLADVFLLTSQSETFSLTCAESLACGTPVIGFDSGGPAEVAPRPYGYFVPFGQVEKLASLLLDGYRGELPIAGDDECVKYARSSFSNERMCEDYLNLYEESRRHV
ncbi:glycosyltransferase family 4 protein [Massilia terrae]|uniref:Glycosyltransferase n=1 Tax=Massilia terrae TaxID=1811224 RepID=A0ABT2CW11_9BURK|nr:glycosyltransferase [Massilia terrae]MCS0658156.1 glycosyltransferase [Massilia terrae]